MAKKKQSSEPKEEKFTKKEKQKLKKEVLIEEQDKLEKKAQKIALKAMTELQIATQVELTDEQKQVASELANGYLIEEVAERFGRKPQEIAAWMAQPSFVRHVDTLTMKSGAAEINERLRAVKRLHDEVRMEMLKRIGDGALEGISFSALSELWLRFSDRIDKIQDKKEDKVANKDLSVLIINHVQSSNQKKYDKISDFLNDPEFKYPSIDVEVEEV